MSNLQNANIVDLQSDVKNLQNNNARLIPPMFIYLLSTFKLTEASIGYRAIRARLIDVYRRNLLTPEVLKSISEGNSRTHEGDWMP